MNIIIGFLFTFALLILSIFSNIFIGYALLLGFLYFALVSYIQGYSIRSILEMSIQGGRQSFVVLKIFVLVGGLASIWMASGTVPTIMYYGLTYMNYNYILIYAFLISAIVAYLLGTALGAVSTVGIVFVLIGKGLGIDLNIIAGAIISGAYLGDRTSPMASSSNLIASLTKTNIYINVRNMIKTTILPVIISVILYYLVSLKFHIVSIDKSLLIGIQDTFAIGLIVLFPSILLLFLSIMKVNVQRSMLMSIGAAFIFSVFLQHNSILVSLKYIMWGFNLPVENSLSHVFVNSGIWGMFQPALVIYISCALAGLLNKTRALQCIEDKMLLADNHFMLFIYTSIMSLFSSAFGCNQSIATVLTYNTMKDAYGKQGISNSQFALDLENTGIVIAPIIPWNLAAFIPTKTMAVSMTGYIPYAFYLFLLPLLSMVTIYMSLAIPKSKFTYFARARQ